MLYYGCDIPEDLYYHPEYDSWVRFDSTGVATLGMTDMAQTMSGKLISIRFKRVGKKIRAGRIAATIESGKWVGPFIMPFDAEITAVNRETFEDDILTANKDPYGAGWLVKARPLHPETAHDDLITGEDAVQVLKEKIDEKDIRCFRCVD